jgi:hypothetical protein
MDMNIEKELPTIVSSPKKVKKMKMWGGARIGSQEEKKSGREGIF